VLLRLEALCPEHQVERLADRDPLEREGAIRGDRRDRASPELQGVLDGPEPASDLIRAEPVGHLVGDGLDAYPARGRAVGPAHRAGDPAAADEGELEHRLRLVRLGAPREEPRRAVAGSRHDERRGSPRRAARDRRERELPIWPARGFLEDALDVVARRLPDGAAPDLHSQIHVQGPNARPDHRRTVGLPDHAPPQRAGGHEIDGPAPRAGGRYPGLLFGGEEAVGMHVHDRASRRDPAEESASPGVGERLVLSAERVHDLDASTGEWPVAADEDLKVAGRYLRRDGLSLPDGGLRVRHRRGPRRPIALRDIRRRRPPQGEERTRAERHEDEQGGEDAHAGRLPVRSQHRGRRSPPGGPSITNGSRDSAVRDVRSGIRRPLLRSSRPWESAARSRSSKARSPSSPARSAGRRRSRRTTSASP
jgi:hypothetical protein